MSALTQRIDEASDILVQCWDKDKEASKTVITDSLSKMGIKDNDMGLEILESEDAVFGDARKTFCDEKGIPLASFRKIWGVLKGTKTESKDTAQSESAPARSKPLSKMTMADLLTLYDPDCEQKIITRIGKGLGQKACIVFNEDKKSVNIPITLEMIREARRRPEMPANMVKDGVAYSLYPVGHFPEVLYNVCPVTGELMIGDYCSELEIEWRVPLEARQFICLLKAEKKLTLDALNIETLQEIYEDKGLAGLKARFPAVKRTFEDKQSTGDLPTLKANHAKTQGRAKTDPFRTRVKYLGDVGTAK